MKSALLFPGQGSQKPGIKGLVRRITTDIDVIPIGASQDIQGADVSGAEL